MQDQFQIRETVANKILNHMRAGNTITALDALTKFGCMRLSARIHQLKGQGHIIDAKYEKNEETGKAYCRYSLVRDAHAQDKSNNTQSVQ
jgi:hypothetical protein